MNVGMRRSDVVNLASASVKDGFRRKAPFAVAIVGLVAFAEPCIAGGHIDDPGVADSLLRRDAKRRIEQHNSIGERVNATGTSAPATAETALPSNFGEPVEDIEARERKRAFGPGKVEGRIDCNTSSRYCLFKDLKLVGTIDDSMLARLTQVFEEFSRRVDPTIQPEGASHTNIKLNSAGGSVAAAMAIGRLLRANRVVAWVDTESVCISACVLAYAGAVVRYGHYNAGPIGIHQPYLDVPARAKLDVLSAKSAYESMLRDMRTYLREVNVSEGLADEMLKVPSTSVRYLSADEQDQFGLVITDPIESEVSDIEQAQELGISRAELMRRQTLAMKECYVRDMASPGAHCYETVLHTGRAPDP